MRWKLSDMSLFGHFAVLFIGGIDRVERIEAVLAIGIRGITCRSSGSFSAAANIAGNRVGCWRLLAVQASERSEQEKHN